MDEVAPAAGRELWDRAGPAYVRLVDYLDASEAPYHYRALRGLRIAASTPPPTRADTRTRVELQGGLLAALEAWAEPYNLHRDDWPIEHALFALEYARAKGGPVPLGSVAPPVVEQYVPHAGPVYHPGRETGPDYLERVSVFMAEVEADYRASGYADTPHKPHASTHLLWLARHQVLGLPYRECAAVDLSNIADAIRELAALLPLTLRPERGRRSK